MATAGALNYALERGLPQLEDDDAVLVQDADSFLDPDFVAVVAARLDDGYAAVGGNFYARPGGGICGAFQRNEYARYARDNARKHGRVLCITGVGTLYSLLIASGLVVPGIAPYKVVDPQAPAREHALHHQLIT